jgi:hypothetical protein
MVKGRWSLVPRFNNDITAEEGFMEEIPAVAVITFAVTVFMITAVSATGLYFTDVARSDALDRAKDLASAVSSYGPLLVEGRSGHLSAQALDSVRLGHLKPDIKNSGEMRITITERTLGGDNQTNGPPSWTFGSTNRTDAPRATFTKTVLVGHPSGGAGQVKMLYRLSTLEVRTW